MHFVKHIWKTKTKKTSGNGTALPYSEATLSPLKRDKLLTPFLGFSLDEMYLQNPSLLLDSVIFLSSVWLYLSSFSDLLRLIAFLVSAPIPNHWNRMEHSSWIVNVIAVLTKQMILGFLSTSVKASSYRMRASCKVLCSGLT